ncbi:MAG: HAD family phosphatase, partial [archaeon]
FQINIYDGVMEILNYLKEKGLALAVVSGAHGEFVRNITSTFFKDFFDIVVSGTDVEHGKPAPDPYLKAIKDLGIEKDEAIVIENAPIGITSGKSAGLKVFALETTLKKEYLQDADKVFKDHKELFSYLSQLF